MATPNKSLKNNKIYVVVLCHKNLNDLILIMKDLKNQNRYDSIERIEIWHDGPAQKDFYDYCEKEDLTLFETQTAMNIWGHNMRKMALQHFEKQFPIIYPNMYVSFLNSDNRLYFHYYSALLKNIECSKEPVGLSYCRIIMNEKSGNIRIIPSIKNPNIEPNNIDILNPLFRMDIAINNRECWNSEYAADYFFIKSCETDCLKNELKVVYTPEIIGEHN